ncbi:hypothetical protein ACHAWF_014077 [Thalassiosira exigua]
MSCLRYAYMLIILISTPIFTGGFVQTKSGNNGEASSIHGQWATANDAKKNDNCWEHEPFDFSCKLGWDGFYKTGLERVRSDGPVGDTVEALEYEWHPHIPPSTIVDAIAPAIMASAEYYSSPSSETNRLPSILLVGCGNSALPRVVHDAFGIPVHVTCLDYSSVCIQMIKSMYEPTCPNMDFIQGDATRLHQVEWGGGLSGGKRFDVIVDKGLLDALMCGEGFDIQSFMEGMNDVLTTNNWGRHILICFRLSKSPKQDLIDLGNVNKPGLAWDFDIPVAGSEVGRASFNMGRRRERQQNIT